MTLLCGQSSNLYVSLDFIESISYTVTDNIQNVSA